MDYLKIIQYEQKQYVKQWKNNAQYYYDNGYYKWMNSHILKCDLLLEIGCGSGLSTLTLLENGHKVIVIDENIECLKETKKLLESNNFSTQIIKRQGIMQVDNDGYKFDYLKMINSIKSQKVLLIQGDVLDDSHLVEWLTSLNIDCVLGWLIGTHGARKFNKKIRKRNLVTATDYRICVERNICDICNKILKIGGYVHFVDRVQAPQDECEIELYLQEFEHDINTLEFKIENTDLKSFIPFINDGMTLVGDKNMKTASEASNVNFISVLLKKNKSSSSEENVKKN